MTVTGNRRAEGLCRIAERRRWAAKEILLQGVLAHCAIRFLQPSPAPTLPHRHQPKTSHHGLPPPTSAFRQIWRSAGPHGERRHWAAKEMILQGVRAQKLRDLISSAVPGSPAHPIQQRNWITEVSRAETERFDCFTPRSSSSPTPPRQRRAKDILLQGFRARKLRDQIYSAFPGPHPTPSSKDLLLRRVRAQARCRGGAASQSYFDYKDLNLRSCAIRFLLPSPDPTPPHPAKTFD